MGGSFYPDRFRNRSALPRQQIGRQRLSDTGFAGSERLSESNSIFRDRQAFEIDDQVITVLSRESLITMKLNTGRTQDRLDAQLLQRDVSDESNLQQPDVRKTQPRMVRRHVPRCNSTQARDSCGALSAVVRARLATTGRSSERRRRSSKSEGRSCRYTSPRLRDILSEAAHCFAA